MKRYVIAVFAALACMLGLGVMTAATAGAAVPASPDDVNPVTVFTGASTQSMAGFAANEFSQTATQVNGTFTLNGEAAGAAVSFIEDEPCVLGNSVTVKVTEDGGVGPGTYYCGAGGTITTTPVSPASPPVIEPEASETVIGSAVGLELCDESSGDAAQLGAVNLGDVGTGGADEWAAGYLTGELEGGVTSPVTNACWGSGVLYGASVDTTFTLLGLLPNGSTVTGQIKQEHSHSRATGDLFTIEANSDLTNYSAFNGGKCARAYYNEADAGVQSDLTGLSAPAVNDLTDFSGVTAVFDGQQHGFAVWNDVTVEASADGIAPALLAPTELTPSVYTRTWHPGHRYYWGKKGHRHYRWIKGYSTSSGSGPSSFSVDAGTPVS